MCECSSERGRRVSAAESTPAGRAGAGAQAGRTGRRQAEQVVPAGGPRAGGGTLRCLTVASASASAKAGAWRVGRELLRALLLDAEWSVRLRLRRGWRRRERRQPVLRRETLQADLQQRRLTASI